MQEIYRQNAGIVVFRADRKVLMCKRANCNDDNCWQFPQGGIDDGETALQAAYRELKEETNISSVKLVKHLDFPIAYKFPANTINKFKYKDKIEVGQEQFWTLFYFHGTDSEINFCTNPDEIEFSDYMWVDISIAPKIVWEPKKEAYKSMVKEFKPIIESFRNAF